MGVENAVEPGLIALCFTTITIINARGVSWNGKITTYPPPSDNYEQQQREQRRSGRYIPLPDTAQFRHTFTSRILWHFPFLIEIWYWNLVYWSYQGARAFSATHLPSDIALTAQAHAGRILHFEELLLLNVELPIHEFFRSLSPEWMLAFRTIYYSHVVLGVCFAGYMYTYRGDVWPRIRRTMALMNVLAFVALTIYRVCPPRLLPSMYGFTDPLHDGQHSAWTQNRFQLIYAAMPSLHFGNSFLVGCATSSYAPHRLLRVLAPLWPAGMLLTIIATANHYVLDAIIGAVITVIAWHMNRIWLYLRPLEAWLMYTLKTEKPEPRRKYRDGCLSSDAFVRGYEAIKDEERQ